MKICSACKKEKSLDEFNKWSKSKDGKQPRCRTCQRAYYREAYHNPDGKRKKQIRAVDKKLLLRNKNFVVQHKEGKPCTDCGNMFPHYVMDFDHVRGKKRGHISTWGIKQSLKTLKKEIDKCELVCANCHRERTWARSH